MIPGWRTTRETIARWYGAIARALRGPWRDAVWEFYERATDLVVWWRAIKRVLKLLNSSVPSPESETTPLMKHADPRNLTEPSNNEAKTR